MKKYIHAFFYLTVFVPSFIFAQNKFYFSFDVGTSFSQLPKKTEDPRAQQTIYSKDKPLTSPLLGTQVHWAVNKRLSFAMGFQHQQRGRIFEENVEGTGKNDFLNTLHEKTRFQQIAFPFSATGHFNIKAFKFNASLGFRHLRTISGEYNMTTVHFSDGAETYRKELSGSPLEATKFTSYNLKKLNQATFGLSFPIISKLEIQTLFHYSPMRFSFYEKQDNSLFFWNCLIQETSIKGNDWQVVLRYNLN